jgi:ubiquinone/menaquinone biosynthesis C-methylase UbiE
MEGKMKSARTFQAIFDSSAAIRNLVASQYYELVSRYLEGSDIYFINYGYSEPDQAANMLELSAVDERDRLPIQMYHHLASSIDLRGKDVLEVSCGRGGGAAFVNRYHHPRSYLGIDRTSRSISYCRRMHQQPGLTFMMGDAEAIDFGCECFDVVLNVEASHLYGHVDRFFHEVHRVLRPGGYLLMTDKRTSPENRLLHQQVAGSGLRLVSERDISQNVLRSIRQQRADRVRRLQELLPESVAWVALHVIGSDGSHLADALASGYSVYLSFVLQKE